MDHDIVTSDVTLYVKWVKKGAPVTLASTEAKTESSKTGDNRAVAAVILLMLMALTAESILFGNKYRFL